MTPVEAPINNPGFNRSRRQGQPTVNVPSEKMAAFLHEIKTVKLRKVGAGVNAMGGDGIAGPSGLSKSVNVTSSASTAATRLRAQELQRRRSLASLRVPIGSSLAAPVPVSALAAAKEAEVRAGQKRKADALGVKDATGVPRMSYLNFAKGGFLMTGPTCSEAPYDGVILPIFVFREPEHYCLIIRNIATFQSFRSVSSAADQRDGCDHTFALFGQ